MQFKQLLAFIKWENERLNNHYGRAEYEKRTYIRTVKVGEEFGELCNEILVCNNDQRTDKLGNKSTKAIEEEFADLIITTLLLAEHLKINIDKSLENKIRKIRRRKY